MRVDIVSIFPDYFSPLGLSLVGRARERGVLDLRVHDLRRWASDRHRSVDDTPYGGGAGMVMRPDVWGAALDDVVGGEVLGGEGAGSEAVGGEPDSVPHLIIPTPSGRPFDQHLASELAKLPWLTFACGRYEGIDARVAEDRATTMPVAEISVGDYVLGGGEAAVLVMVEAIARLVPGVVGNPESLVEESHADAGLLEYPVYTRPAQWRGRKVPEVLVSGDHARVGRWRRDQALARTVQRRPDLLAALPSSEFDEHDRAVLSRYGWTFS